jgi:hypothetical protein
MRSYFKNVCYLVVVLWISAAQAGPKEDFYRAIAVDQPHIITALLNEGFDPNVRDEQGQVALYLALRAESLEAAAALLAHPRIEVDAVNPAGETPLMMAALRGQLDMARQLMEKGATINRAGWTPLHYAASGPEPRLVRLLLDKGAVIDARSPNGSTPLMMAARYGAIDAADLLRERGADASLRNERGMDAADFAASAGREKLQQRLLPR